MIGIYRIYHISTGKSYIGKSTDIPYRIRKRFLGQDKRSYIGNAIRKYGADAFNWEVLELCSEDLLNNRECHWIATLDCVSPNGYNLTYGGDGGRHSNEVRERISKTLSNRGGQDHHMTGRKHSEETRQKMSKQRKGRKQSPEWIANRTKIVKGQKRPNISGEKHPMYGKKHSPETLAKIREGQRRYYESRRSNAKPTHPI